jgi:hypothetical protein
MPQILLGGLFVPPEQMVDWLQTISDALPLTYVIEALGEVGSEPSLLDCRACRTPLVFHVYHRRTEPKVLDR